MKFRKTVTEKTLAANRLNSKRSTGPRTERGKNTSKFNAVKAGLFAKHVVIPVIDGADSGEFPRLVADLQREFQPEGPAEEFYVAEMAKSMWRVRRASLCEKGSVRSEAMWAGNRPLVGVELSKLTDIELSILKKAQEEYEGTGTLSRATYQILLPLLNDNYPIDLGLRIAQRNLEPLYMVQTPTESVSDELFHNSLNVGAEVVEDYYAGHALPPEAAMNQILRYEKAAQKKFDWALQRLLESQERRRKAQAAVSV
jgi:hypothetical protein